MKSLCVFLLGALVLGADSFNMEELESQFILRGTSMVEEFLAPLKTVQNDFAEIYSQAKSNYLTKGYVLKSTDDCLTLSKTTQTVYNLAVNATQFAASSAKEILSKLNEVIDCPNDYSLLTKVVKCMFDDLKSVRQDILDTERKFIPYQTKAAQLYSQMVSELHACVGF